MNLMAGVVMRYRWLLHAWVLMTNHDHLVVETPETNLSRGMKDLDGDYAQAFNLRWGRVGPLFQGRFHGKLIEKENYLLEVIRYVVLNPVRADMVEGPADWVWSSYRATAGMAPEPPWLEVDDTLRRFDPKDRAEARRRYREFVAQGVGKELRIWDELKCGLYLGGVAFGEKLEELIRDRKLEREYPRIQRHPARPGLEEIERAIIEVTGTSIGALRHGRGGDARTLFAVLAREEGIVPGEQIGRALGIGESGAAKLVREGRRRANEKSWRATLNRIRERIRLNRRNGRPDTEAPF